MKGILKVCNEKYIVNEENGVVTYIIRATAKNKDSQCFTFYPYAALKKLGYKCDAFFERDFNVVGKAKCSPEDTFDLTKGIQIARNRAEIKLAQVEQMVIRTLCKEIGRVWDYTSALYNNRSKMIKEKKQFIKNI